MKSTVLKRSGTVWRSMARSLWHPTGQPGVLSDRLQALAGPEFLQFDPSPLPRRLRLSGPRPLRSDGIEVPASNRRMSPSLRLLPYFTLKVSSYFHDSHSKFPVTSLSRNPNFESLSLLRRRYGSSLLHLGLSLQPD